MILPFFSSFLSVFFFFSWNRYASHYPLWAIFVKLSLHLQCIALEVPHSLNEARFNYFDTNFRYVTKHFHPKNWIRPRDRGSGKSPKLDLEHGPCLVCPSREDQLRTFHLTSLPLLPKMMEKRRVREFGSVAQTKHWGHLHLRLMSLPKCYSNVLKVLPFYFKFLFCLCETSLLHMEGECCQILIWRIKNLFLTNWSSRNWSKPKQLWRSVASKQRGERDLISLHLGSLLIDLGFPGSSEVKASASNAGDPGSIPGLGRSPGEGNGNPLQYSCLENPMDGEAW